MAVSWPLAKVEVVGSVVSEMQYSPSSSYYWRPSGGMYYHTLAAEGDITAEIFWRRISSSTARIKRARLEIWRVS